MNDVHEMWLYTATYVSLKLCTIWHPIGRANKPSLFYPPNPWIAAQARHSTIEDIKNMVPPLITSKLKIVEIKVPCVFKIWAHFA